MVDNVYELKSTQFREGRNSYKGIRGVAGLTRKSIRKSPVVQSKVMLAMPVNGEGSNGNIYGSTEVETTAIAGISVILIVVPCTGQTESL